MQRIINKVLLVLGLTTRPFIAACPLASALFAETVIHEVQRYGHPRESQSAPASDGSVPPLDSLKHEGEAPSSLIDAPDPSTSCLLGLGLVVLSLVRKTRPKT